MAKYQKNPKSVTSILLDLARIISILNSMRDNLAELGIEKFDHFDAAKTLLSMASDTIELEYDEKMEELESKLS